MRYLSVFIYITLPLIVIAQNRESNDTIKTKMLNEVVVEGASQYTSSNKTTYIPDRNSKRTAQNAADLLAKMAIPQIMVNPASGNVQTNGGKDVSIYIDYELATEAEKEALNPIDVKKVEYLIYPNDPRFGNDHYVINIILNHYDYGGYAKITGIGNILAGSGSGQAYVKTSYKRMTYDINFYDKYSDRGHTGTEQDQIFRFPQSDGNIAEIKRSTTLDDSRYQQNHYWGSFRARYDSDNTSISNTVGITSDNQPHSDYTGRILFSSPLSQSSESFYANMSNSKSFNPYWNGIFYFNLGHQWQLSVNTNVDYTHNTSYSLYNSANADIITDATENQIEVKVQGKAAKNFNKNHTLGLWFLGVDIYDKVKYTGNTTATPVFNQYAWTIVPSYTFSSKKLNFQIVGGVAVTSNSINGMRDSYVLPTGALEVSYTPNDKSQFELSFNYNISNIELVNKTPDIFQVNELLWQTGNPQLKNKESLGLNINYSWFPNNKFLLSPNIGWYHVFQFIAPVFTPTGPEGTMLRTPQDVGQYDFLNIGVSASLRLFSRSLVLTASPRLIYENLTGIYRQHLVTPRITLSASYYLKNWYATIYYSSIGKNLPEDDNNAICERNKDYYSLKIGWSNGKLNISASVNNIFRRNWLDKTAWIDSEWYDSTTRTYSASSHQFINITASYTFNFGKKIKHGDELQNSGGTSSAIMK